MKRPVQFDYYLMRYRSHLTQFFNNNRRSDIDMRSTAVAVRYKGEDFLA